MAQTSGPIRPDYSGAWMRVSQQCQPQEKSSGSLGMVVEQHDSTVRVTWNSIAKGTKRELPLIFQTTGEELHYTGLDGDDFRSKLHWRGSDLVFETVEKERGTTVQVQEVWKLPNDGTKLVRIKTENSRQEHSSCTSIFAKEPRFSTVSERVKINLEKDRIAVDIDGKAFTNLYMGLAANKPFLYPLRTASGKKVTRGYPVEPLETDPTDHPHQKGLWVGSEHLSNMDFWENDSSYKRPHMGRVVFKDVLESHAEADRGSFTILADWINEHGESVLTEKRKIIFYAEPANSRMFDVELELKPKQEVTFEDHHDAVIGIRLGPAFDEKNGGRPVNAQGLTGEAKVRGQRSEWVDWGTDLEGEAVGVALLDHPSNYSFPTRWHVRSMGLLVASPFAQRTYDPEAADNSKTLGAGETLRLRYRVLIHPKSVDVAAAYREFASQLSAAVVLP